MAAKHSDVYYMSESDGTFIPSKSAVSVRNDFGADLFKHKGMIFEGSTGARVCGELGLADMLERFKGKPSEFADVVSKYTADHGLSPRYTQPEVKKVDLFPPDDRRKLSKALFHEGKSWFFRLPFDTGPEIYTTEKEFAKTGINSSLYTPCNGWMIPLSIIDNPKDRLADLAFNLHDYIQSRFETMLTQPMRWIDVSIGEFLGRREETDAHNHIVRQARNAANSERDTAREAERHEREVRAAAEYSAAIQNAELALLAHKPVGNMEIGGQNLLLQLFRENGIVLPLKTQGWVKSSLTQIQHISDSQVSFRYCGNRSSVIGGYIHKLTVAVEAKHQSRAAVSKSSVINTLGEHQKTIAAQERASPVAKRVQPDL